MFKKNDISDFVVWNRTIYKIIKKKITCNEKFFKLRDMIILDAGSSCFSCDTLLELNYGSIFKKF